MLRKFAGSAVAAKVNFGGHSAAAYPALSRVNIRGHSAAAKVTLAAEAQPAKLRKVGGYHLSANDEHAAVLTPPKLRNIGGRRSGRQNSAQISGFARTPVLAFGFGKNNKSERTPVVLWTETNAQPPALHTLTPMRMHVARMRRRHEQ